MSEKPRRLILFQLKLSHPVPLMIRESLQLTITKMKTGENPLTCAFARRISKPFRNFEMGLESGKLRILSITTSSCWGEGRGGRRFGHPRGTVNHPKSQGTEEGPDWKFHAKALLREHLGKLRVKLPGLQILPKINTLSAALLWK